MNGSTAMMNAIVLNVYISMGGDYIRVVNTCLTVLNIVLYTENKY